MKYVKKLVIGAALFLPALAAAQTGGDTGSQLWDKIVSNIVTPLIELISLAAFLVFIWGVVDFIRGADDAEKRATGQQHIMYGIIGLVIIFGAGALISILKATFGLQ